MTLNDKLPKWNAATVLSLKFFDESVLFSCVSFNCEKTHEECSIIIVINTEVFSQGSSDSSHV